MKVEGCRLILASSGGERDGIALELDRDADGEQVAEVFEDGATGDRTFRCYTDQPVPVEAVEWLIAQAQTHL